MLNCWRKKSLPPPPLPKKSCRRKQEKNLLSMSCDRSRLWSACTFRPKITKKCQLKCVHYVMKRSTGQFISHFFARLTILPSFHRKISHSHPQCTYHSKDSPFKCTMYVSLERFPVEMHNVRIIRKFPHSNAYCAYHSKDSPFTRTMYVSFERFPIHTHNERITKNLRIY